MSRLGCVRFHKPKNFRTHMQTSTLGHRKGLSTVQTTDSVKRKEQISQAPPRIKELQDCLRDINHSVCTLVYITTMCSNKGVTVADNQAYNPSFFKEHEHNNQTHVD